MYSFAFSEKSIFNLTDSVTKVQNIYLIKAKHKHLLRNFNTRGFMRKYKKKRSTNV